MNEIDFLKSETSRIMSALRERGTTIDIMNELLDLPKHTVLQAGSFWYGYYRDKLRSDGYEYRTALAGNRELWVKTSKKDKKK